MSDTNIIIETEESERPIVNINGLPSSSNEITPLNSGNKFNIKDDDDSVSSNSTVSIKKKKPSSNYTNMDYGMYADPRKMSKKVESDSEEEDEEEYSEDESDDDDDEDDDQSEYSKAESEVFKKPEKKSNMTEAEIKIKKKELLLKLHDAEQSGYQITGKYNMNSPLDELDAEYTLYESRMEQNAMVDLLQDGLMFIIKGIEMFNGFYKPMGVNLVGLSDKIYDRREQLEHVLKRLAVKYSGGTSMPPELSLLFIIGGAMVMTHISNTALSSGGIEKLLGGLTNTMTNTATQGGENPLMNMFSGIMKNMNNKQQQSQTPKAANEPQQKMKGPTMDINSLLSQMKDVKPTKPVDPFTSVGGGSNKELPFKNMGIPEPRPFPSMTRDRDIGKPGTTAKMPDSSDRFSVSSDISSDAESIMDIKVPSRKKTKKGKKNVFQI